MNRNINLIGCLSIVLMLCVLAGQGVWLYHVNKIKTDEYQQTVSFILNQSVESHFQKKVIEVCAEFGLTPALKSDMKTFIWGPVDKRKEKELSNPFQELNGMSRDVTYDFLYQNQLLDLQKINSVYDSVLQEKGIFQAPILLLQDRKTKDVLMRTDSLSSLEAKIFSSPIDIGYDCNHQFVAAFNQPSIFSSMTWHWVLEFVFLFGFIYCFVWQLRMIKMMWRSAKVQTMGVAHLEHELKKPLSTSLLLISDIVDPTYQESIEIQHIELKMVKAHLKKTLEVIETMLTALKSSRLEVKRESIDVQQEMELIVDMFARLASSAKVEFHIEKGAEKALLDTSYFTCMLINLVDNAIKYNENNPTVKIWFGKEGEYWILKVTDNGIGIPLKDFERIYQQFYRVDDELVANNAGFGLGLVFVKKVANAHGGDVKVVSDLGKGSCFTIRLK